MDPIPSTSRNEEEEEQVCMYKKPCNGCSWGYSDFLVLAKCECQRKDLYDFLYSHRLIPCHARCPRCGSLLEPKTSTDRKNLVFRCRTLNRKNRRKCSFNQTIVKNSFFDHAHLTIPQVCELVVQYISRPPPRCRVIMSELKTTSKTVVDWFSFMREVFISWAVENSTQIGGEGTVVEIDEAKIGKRKYNRGRLLEGQWVFGGIQRDTQKKKFFVVAVEDRSAPTLMEVIRKYIRPHTTIMSDCWKAYDSLGEEHYQHLTVNHSLNFVDPETGAHTQNIERCWVEVRKLVPRFGRKKEHYEGYLSECLFMINFRDHRQRIHEFWNAMPEPWQPPERKSLLSYLKLITVEPTMVLYMMAFMTTSVVEQAFFVNKACRVNHGLNTTICDNLTADEYKDLNKEVQVTVSNFHLYNDIAGHVVPIILALFMGAWSDKRGRKLPLLIGLVGKLYYSTMVVVNAMQDTWPLEYVVYTATLPMAFTGADVAIFAAAFTYLVDISSQESRTMRVTLLEVCYLATMPTGIALGKFLFNQVVDKSYAIMFGINVGLLALALIYSYLRLDWRTNKRQKPLSEAPNLFTDFFDYNHVVDTGKTIFKFRRHNRRCYLLILIAMMAFYTFQRDEKNMSYLYVQLTFKWSFDEFSNFRTVQSTVQDLFLLFAIPLMSRVFGWRDTIIIMIGALAHSVGRIFFATAIDSWVFYLGGIFAAIGPIVAPVIRSMVSKLVANSEKGKTLAILAVADNAIPLVSGTMYSKVYNATIHTHPNAIFYLTMATQMTVFILILFIHIKAKDKYLIHEDEDVKTECLEKEDESS